MFKLVVLSCLVSVAFAGLISAPYTVAQIKTVVEPHVSVVETPTVNHVGSVVKNIPTGVSHQSSSVVHSSANYVEPIYAHGVQKSVVSTPVVKNIVEHVPVVAKSYYAEPIVAKSYYSEPIVAKSYYTEPAKSYQYAAAPLAYSAPVYSHKALSYASLPASYSSYSSLPYAAYAPHTSYAAYAPETSYAHQW